MISKFTMTNVAIELANKMYEDRGMDEAIKLANAIFEERCTTLDERLPYSLKKAFEGEKISQERMQRIVCRFCDILLKN